MLTSDEMTSVRRLRALCGVIESGRGVCDGGTHTHRRQQRLPARRPRGTGHTPWWGRLPWVLAAMRRAAHGRRRRWRTRRRPAVCEGDAINRQHRQRRVPRWGWLCGRACSVVPAPTSSSMTSPSLAAASSKNSCRYAHRPHKCGSQTHVNKGPPCNHVRRSDSPL